MSAVMALGSLLGEGVIDGLAEGVIDGLDVSVEEVIVEEVLLDDVMVWSGDAVAVEAIPTRMTVAAPATVSATALNFAKALSLAIVMYLVSGCTPPGLETAPGSASIAPRHDGNQNVAPGGTGASRLRPLVLTDNGTEDTVTIATSIGASVEIWDKPGGAVASTINAADVLTAPDATPLVFLVKSQQADWFEIYLPVRPNGSTGWVRGSQVTLSGTGLALEV